MFNAYHVPRLEVQCLDVASSEVQVLGTTPQCLEYPGSVRPSSLIRPLPKVRHAYRPLGRAGQVPQRLHRDRSPKHLRQNEPGEHTHSSDFSTHGALRFSSLKCSFMKLHCQGSLWLTISRRDAFIVTDGPPSLLQLFVSPRPPLRRPPLPRPTGFRCLRI